MSLWGSRADETPEHEQALRRCAQNLLHTHRETLASVEKQIEQIGNALLRVASALETQKASHLIFGVRRPKKKHILWWQRSEDEKAELESEFVGLTTGELRWIVTMLVELTPGEARTEELCYLCTRRERQWSAEKEKMVWVVIEAVYHHTVPPRSEKATRHVNHLLAVARRVIGAIVTRTGSELQYSGDPTLSIDKPADLQDQIVTGRALSKRIVAEIREGVRISREDRL